MDQRLILQRGRDLVAAWSLLPDRAVRDGVLRSGFDAVLFDMQHGMHDARSVEEGLSDAALMGKPALVRVPLGDLGFVSRALDMGAGAVIMPMIESVEDARALVTAAKYAPLGQRSFGPGRAETVRGFKSTADYMAAADGTALALAMIETSGAYRDLDAILAVEGLDGVFVGPADLSIALTGALQPNCETVVEAARTIARKTREAGKFAAIYAGAPDEAARAWAFGYDLVGFSSDVAMIRSAADVLSASARR